MDGMQTTLKTTTLNGKRIAYSSDTEFLVPFFIIAVGSVSWAIGGLMGYHLSWMMSCLLFGVPFAGFTVWCIYGID